MKRTLTLLAATLLVCGLCFGGTVSGYIADEGCARAGEARNASCAKNCIKNGANAVLVTDAGKIYSIAEQDKVKKFAGETVEITGAIEGEKIKSIETAVACGDSKPCKG